MREIHAKNVSIIDLGRQGENLVTQVIYDLSDWIAAYGDGTAELIHKRVGDSQPYPVAAVRDGNTLIWTITSTDTAVATRPLSGYGQCELRWHSGDVLAKSKTWKTMVSRAMEAPSETAPPDHDQGWVDQVVAAGVSAKASAESAKADADRAETAAIKQPYPDAESGTWWIWDAVSGAYVDSGFSALPDTIAGCIHAPATAEVGQTIVVKAVDENGKPTEWEAADLAGGSLQETFDYEKTIVLTEDAASITIDTFDDGTPLALKKVEVVLVGSNATSSNQWVIITPDYDLAVPSGRVSLGGGSYANADKWNYLFGTAEINDGEISAEYAMQNNITRYLNLYCGISSTVTKVKPAVTFNDEDIFPRKATKFISIRAEVATGSFLAGTKLRIRGVKA